MTDLMLLQRKQSALVNFFGLPKELPKSQRGQNNRNPGRMRQAVPRAE
jgi:hypothetical protein